MVGGCGIGCDHGQMWWNAKCGACEMPRCAVLCKMWCEAGCSGVMRPIYGAIRNVAWSTWIGMWRYVVRNVKWDAMRDVV